MRIPRAVWEEAREAGRGLVSTQPRAVGVWWACSRETHSTLLLRIAPHVLASQGTTHHYTFPSYSNSWANELPARDLLGK